MSCDNTTWAYCERTGARIAPALGISLAAATALVLQVHEMGTIRATQALAARKGNNGQGAAGRQAALTARAADTAAEEATVEIFRDMRAMIPQMAVPAHGDANPQYGFALPKRPIQYGWKEVRDLRRIAVEGTEAGLSAGVLRARLSPLASEVLHAQQAQSGASGGARSAGLRLGMARRGYQTGPASILIEVEGQLIPITGSDFGTILTAIKALPGVDGRCFNADVDGRGKRWVVPGTSAAVAAALHGYGMIVANTMLPTGTPAASRRHHDAQAVLTATALPAAPVAEAPMGSGSLVDAQSLPGAPLSAAAPSQSAVAHAQPRPSDDRATDAESSQSGRICADCGEFMGQSPHACRPAWIESYPDDLRSRAQQFVTGLPGIVELANGSKPLGSGPHASTERRALETYTSYMQETDGIGPDAMQVAAAFRDQPFRNAQAFAAVIVIASGVQKCPDCGQFMSATVGHACPARLSAVPTDAATIDWLGALAGTDAVRQAYNLRGGWEDSGWGRAGGSISRNFSTSQTRIWADSDDAERNDDEELDDEQDDDEESNDDANGEQADEYGLSDRAAAFWKRRDWNGEPGRDMWAQDRAAREARTQAVIDGLLPTAREILAENIADNAQVPTALYIAADAFDARPDVDNARLLAGIISDLARGRPSRLLGLPSEHRVTAWRAMRAAPDLPDLANGLVAFGGDDGKIRAALDEAARALSVRDTLPAGLNDAVIDYAAQRARYAADLAGALCAAGGVQQCGKCGQFIGTTAHVCAVISANGKIYDQNGYDREGYNRRGYNQAGYNQAGLEENGYSKQGLDKDGYNRAGFNTKGFRKDTYNEAGFDGTGYAVDGRDEQGYDRQGLDPDGYDKNGVDAHGFDRNGWNKAGQNAAGQTHRFFVADARGRYGDGFDADGFDEGGYAADGRDLYGYDKNGIGPYGYDRWGFSAWGLDSQDRDRGGFALGLGADGFDRTGYNAVGLDRNGFSFTGYDNEGKDRFGQERTSTVSPKTGKALPAKYTQSGTDQFGYDRWGVNKKTGLTAADAQGRQYNYCGWVYDAASNRCVNLRNPAAWVPHTGWSWDRRPGGYLGHGQGYLGNGYAAPRVTPGARYAPPPPPIDPRMPPTFEAFKQGAPMPQAYETGKGYFADDRKIREQYDKLIKGSRKRRVGYRWLHSEQRLAEDAQAVLAGVPLRCPACGRFTGGKPHACPTFGNQLITSFFSGVVRGGAYDAVLQTPHNPSYSVPTTMLTENVRQGYTQDPNDARCWVDAEGYDFEGLSENGFDRAGYTKAGFNRFGYDRDGFDRRGYNKDGLDRDGHSRPLTLAVVANGLAEGQDPINNRHIADTFSRVATQIAGRPRRVVFREPGSGFATDMQGKIFADPQPLGPDAPHAQQLVAIKAGIYHELGHEQFTSMELWAAILDIMQSKKAQDVEVDLRFAGLGVQTVRVDHSRAFVKDAYNIVEDGRMERRIDDRYAGAGEILAADALVNPRWGENTRAPDGTVLPTEDVVPWALLYEALPFFNLRPSTYARMAGESRALFDELAPVVRAAVNGKPEDAWAAAVYIAARMEQAGVQMPQGSRGTDPGTPPPGTEARRPKIVIDGDQVIDAGQGGGGGGGGGMDMDVEFRGHVTVKGQMPSGGGGGGQTTFAGGVTYEEQQQNRDQQGQQGQPGDQSAQEGGGGGGDQLGAQGQPGQQGASGGSGEQQGGQGQPDQGEGQGGGSAGDRQYQPAGQQGAGQSGGSDQGEDDDTNGRGQGWRKGLGQGEDATGQDRPPGQASDGGADPNGQQQGARDGSAVADADMEDYWKDWNADSQQDAVGNDPGQQRGRGQGAGGRGHSATRQGGSPFRDAASPFTKAQLAGVLASAEREAVSALDSGIRVESRVEVLGTALHQPLGNRSSAKQRYKTTDGRIEGVQVGMPRASAATVDQWKGRRTDHKKVAGRMATVLQAIRADIEKRLRNLPEGALDRRRIVRAAAGQQNVRTQSLTLPQTSFRASVAVDLSGSMSHHIRSGALYDAMMVLGDTFELLDIPYESRAFGSTDAQFKAMDEPTFSPARAAALTETNLGGTQLSSTAGLAMTALRGGAEANRLFVSLTDGDVGDQAATAAVLKDARKRGIVTFGIFLGHSANKESMDELWGAGNWTQINALEEMPKAVGQRLAALFNRLAQR